MTQGDNQQRNGRGVTAGEGSDGVDSSTSPSRTLASVLSPKTSTATNPHAAADAARAMQHAKEWKPALDRRQSWSREEKKREVLMKVAEVAGDDGGGGSQELGFTEKKA